MAKTMVSWQAFPSLPPSSRAPRVSLAPKTPFLFPSNACHAGYDNLTFCKESWRAGPSVIQHSRKTLHSRIKENRLVIQIQGALWRKLQPLFSRNKKLYASKEVKENALASEGKSCRPETITTVNRYVCHDLSVWNMRLKSPLLSVNVEPSRA